MKKKRFGLTMSLLLTAGMLLGGCGQAKEEGKASDFSVAMVTDVG